MTPRISPSIGIGAEVAAEGDGAAPDTGSQIELRGEPSRIRLTASLPSIVVWQAEGFVSLTIDRVGFMAAPIDHRCGRLRRLSLR